MECRYGFVSLKLPPLVTHRGVSVTPRGVSIGTMPYPTQLAPWGVDLSLSDSTQGKGFLLSALSYSDLSKLLSFGRVYFFYTAQFSYTDQLITTSSGLVFFIE